MELRPATPEDALEVARLHVRAWQVAYRGLVADAFLDGLRPEDWASRYTFGASDPAAPATIVAVVDQAIVGLATTAPARDEDAAGCGELCALYVDPHAWSTGAGRTLIANARERLAAAGHQQAVLWVLQGNERAERFYVRDGWSPDGTERVEEIRGLLLPERRFRRPLP